MYFALCQRIANCFSPLPTTAAANKRLRTRPLIEVLDMSVHALSLALRVPATRLHEVVNERRSITPDTALRLARYFSTDAQSWLNLQLSYDLKIAEAELKTRIEREVHAMAA
ncbi:MAG: HigA family addiction module antitoxin [Gallionella sp.]